MRIYFFFRTPITLPQVIGSRQFKSYRKIFYNNLPQREMREKFKHHITIEA